MIGLTIYFILMNTSMYLVVHTSEHYQNQTQTQSTIIADIPPNAELIEIRKTISSIIEKLNSVDSGIATFTPHVKTIKALSMVLESMGIWKCNSCRMNANGVCIGWRLPEDLSNSLRNLLGENAVTQQDGIYRFRIDRLPFVGAVCPIYMQRQ